VLLACHIMYILKIINRYHVYLDQAKGLYL